MVTHNPKYRTVGIVDTLHLGMKLEALSERSLTETIVQPSHSGFPRDEMRFQHKRPNGHQTHGGLIYGFRK